MKGFINGLINVIGRVLLVAIFLMSAIGNKIPKFNQVAEYMASEGIPAPKLLLTGAIIFLIAGSVSLLIGYKARAGAALLFAFLLPTTYWFHDFWNFEEPLQIQYQTINFMKNAALMGAMLIILARGVGVPGMDAQKLK